ncbi:ninjurin-2-like isoform X2 [Penaeus japonicus]|uniref:ninjurin-2-like isoform X2 n=1 Tax=Penaeus japonicus TaxID=27405 RepID=UPI001C70D02D|nr:ninjurin-2-like isoform X2 [Penaeus japonicus]
MSDRLFTPTNKVDEVKNRNGTMSVEPQVMTVGGGKTLDPNRYATKKTVAQGMLDIALLTANASQLKYVLRIGEKHEFYSLMLGLIITSLVLQLLVGLMSFSLSMLRDCRLHLPQYRISALVINHINLISVFIITTLNILISGFGIYPSATTAIRSPIF